MKVRRVILVLLYVAAFVAGALTGKACFSQTQTITGPARVIDGDTLEIQGQRVRLHGVDAPESSQLCGRGRADYHCGYLAVVELERLIGGRPVTCAPREKDRYGRTVARCFVQADQQMAQTHKALHIDLSGWLVRNGLAVAYVKYSRDYVPQETVARGARLGIWAGTFVQPDQWRRRVRPGARPGPGPGRLP